MNGMMVRVTMILTLAITASTRGAGEVDPRLHPDGQGWGFYRAASDRTDLPRVLLIGDSIVNGYRGAVAARLKDKAVVDVWITGLNENSPQLHDLLRRSLSNGPYAVVHFNIGLHGWQTGRIPDGQYEPLMRKYVATLREGAPKAALIWASTTPVTVQGAPGTLNPDINPIIVERNALAAGIMKESAIPVDDLYGLMSNRLALARGDMFHWTTAGQAIQADAVSAAILAHLSASAVDSRTADAIRAWQQLGYGMFIHFGMSTFTGREIDPGDRPSTTYAPTALDVDQWIVTAKAAGMKYAVLTSKHVAGHCLWDSKVTFRGKEFDYDVATSGNTNDVVRAFVDACKKHGVAPGLYWCLLDFHNNSVPQGPQWNKGDLPDDFFQFAQDQLAELIRNYPEVSYYWIDIPRAASAAERQTLYDLIKKLRPGTVVLFNHGTAQPAGALTIAKCQAAWPTDVLNTERNPVRPGDFSPRQSWQGAEYYVGYEHCDCQARNWFWVDGDKPRPASELYRLHRDTLAAGGNLLLDVPPDRTGRIPQDRVKALMDLKGLIDNPPPTPLNAGKPATASNVYKGQSEYVAAAAVDDNPSTRWATDDGITNAWLEIDLGAAKTFGRAVISAAYPELDRIRAFRIEYRDGDAWKIACIGGRIVAETAVNFPPVTARFVRLNITEATNGPTIREFQLFTEGAKAPIGRPSVIEVTHPDGKTELQVHSAGGAVVSYRADLTRHHAPATNDTGLVKMWEGYRFGGFVCFNDNQFGGGEFSKNTDPSRYNPAELDVEGWAKAMKAAGMKYAVLTTRHTSGFLLWDSATSDFDVAASPNTTDVVRAFAEACRHNNIAPGFYYCLWGGPAWMPNPNARAIILAQLCELATRYGEIPYFWIDMGNWRPADLSAQEIYDLLKNLQPKAVVILNQHIQDGSKIAYFPTDILNGEVHTPPVAGHQPFREVNGIRYYLPFEFEPVSQRIAHGTTTPWGPVGAWFTVRDSQPIPARQLCDWIKEAYGRGAANVLLSLAADHTGRMRPDDIEQLRELGKLLRAERLIDP